MDNIKFTGYMENVLTFECEGAVEAGDLVNITASGKVGKATEGGAFIGECVNQKNGIAAVQLGGYIETAKTGTVAVGYQKLVADANGGVKTASAGKERLVIFADDTTVGYIL